MQGPGDVQKKSFSHLLHVITLVIFSCHGLSIVIEQCLLLNVVKSRHVVFMSSLCHQDGTVKLWEYESGRRLQSWDLNDLKETQSVEDDKEKVTTAWFILQH